MARLKRVSDNKQESGSRVEAWSLNADRSLKEIKGHEPIIGCCLLVGSVTARSYSKSDYWITTPIKEIVEKKEGYIKFKTENSTYEFWA